MTNYREPGKIDLSLLESINASTNKAIVDLNQKMHNDAMKKFDKLYALTIKHIKKEASKGKNIRNIAVQYLAH